MRRYATVRGYRLEIGPHWDDYGAPERGDICNGVGAEGQPPWLAALLNALPYLSPASIPHDIDYHAGGTSRDRRAADRRMRRNCYRIARAEIGGFWSRLFSSVRRVQWTFAAFEIEAAYVMLRAFGTSAFRYDDQPGNEETT